MMSLKVPIISLLIGEGGSGGALALSVADEVWCMENAIYSVISPEGCASILWKDAAKKQEAADALKLTAQELYRLGVVELVVEEREDFSKHPQSVFDTLRQMLENKFASLLNMDTDELLSRRYLRFRRFGTAGTDSK